MTSPRHHSNDPGACSRRNMLAGLAAFAAMPTVPRPSILRAPISLGGDWAGSVPASVLKVITRTRAEALAGVPLISDRQPRYLQVDNARQGLPHIWLHFDDAPWAQIVLDVGERDWSKLAYQFGHEFGHVLANGWLRDTHPGGPAQWLEEALVETFSLRALSLLATSWEAAPPFPDDSAFGGAIRRYRDNILTKYTLYSGRQGTLAAPGVWYRERREHLAETAGLSETCEALVPLLLETLADDPVMIGELGALNRWAEHSWLPLPSYLQAWSQSCHTLGQPGRLPDRIRTWLIA